MHPSLRPAAFPSMATDQAPREPMKEHGHHGLRRWMEARTNCDQAGLRKMSLLVDLMYGNEWFPDNMEEQQKAWYAELKDRWLPDDAPVQVSHLIPLTRSCDVTATIGVAQHC